MKIVIDSAIPFIQGVLEPYADVKYIAGNKITAQSIADCDALIIRTRTKCDEKLLKGSRVKFIATATIGTDHIDIPYCLKQRIIIASAGGCNARGVLQWVAAALKQVAMADNKRPEEYTLGVVGVGNVGSLVSKYAKSWGFKVLECDPPRQSREGGDFVNIEQIAKQCDIVTLHTPLDSSTHHLIDEAMLGKMRNGVTIINASRGSVADNGAVAKIAGRYIFDVWEDEPDIEQDILNGAMLATPHIAGYSKQGKANATAMSVRALASFFGLPLMTWYPEEVERIEAREISWDDMCSSIDDFCPITAQSNQLKDNPTEFENIRNNYNYRNEYF